jgi:hypothetical protein
MGLFGRKPQAFIFHMWATEPAALSSSAALSDKGLAASVKFTAGFQLSNYGPGVARDLYVNTILWPPKGPSQAHWTFPSAEHWIAQKAFGVVVNMFSKDGYKLPPKGLAQPIVMHFSFAPPFYSDFRYEITFGSNDSPVRQIDARVSAEDLNQFYSRFVQHPSPTAGNEFVEAVMDLKRHEQMYREVDLVRELGGEAAETRSPSE